MKANLASRLLSWRTWDTYAPQSDKDVENNLGGLTLQG
ncbi:peptidase M28 [Klebsiella michiganensis]|nr:peptidase M28 [Klebsiella michiganensis]